MLWQLVLKPIRKVCSTEETNLNIVVYTELEEINDNGVFLVYDGVFRPHPTRDTKK